jgi:hypothetical protein
MEPPDNDCPACDEAQAKIEELEAEIHKLKVALETYGRHTEECNVSISAPWVVVGPCTCGWSQVAGELI